MKKLILTRGIQGSGKSTWARQWVEEDPENRVRINNDDIRNMLGKYWVLSRESLVSNIKEDLVEQPVQEVEAPVTETVAENTEVTAE